MKKLSILLFVSSFLWLGCSSSPDDCLNGPVTSDISRTTSGLTQLEVRGDQPASDAFRQISQKFDKKEAFRMNIYALSTTKDSDIVFDVVEKNNIQWKRNKSVAIKGSRVHQWYANSGFESIFDADKHHRLEGVSRDALKPDSFYLQTAQVFMDQELKPETNGHFKYYPYKQRHAVTATDDGTDSGIFTETVDEVGVAFASMLDGWPVIGAGGKIYIHMLPNGEVVSHSTYRKIPSTAVDTLTESDIKTPEEAYHELLNTWELNSSDYRILRQEFGYYFRGRNSIQNYIAPYYTFFIQSLDPNSPTVLMRPILAVKGEKATRILADEALENDRKVKQLNGIHEMGDFIHEDI